MEELLKPFLLSDNKVQMLADEMEGALLKGLQEGPPNSDIAMLPSFVPFLPDGSETGTYLGMDLGGTNLRIMSLTLEPSRKSDPQLVESMYVVPDSIMVGTGVQLFQFLAQHLQEFLRQNSLTDQKLSLGFVFSWPCDQTKLGEAKLLWWCKGFNCCGTVGENVVQMLQKAIDELGLSVSVVAITNDSVGQLVACAYEHGHNCVIGGVISTGCNFSYMESTNQITKLASRSDINYKFDQMIVDTEWQENGNSGQLDFLKTEIDVIIDETSVHKGKQIQDKYIAAMYLGEIVRLLMIQAANIGIFEDGKDSVLRVFQPKASFTSRHISLVLRSDSGDDRVVCAKDVLREMGIDNPPSVVVHALYNACQAVSDRSASVLSGALCGLLKHMQRVNPRETLLIGVGGSLYQNHPTYANLLDANLTKLLPPDLKWKVVFTDKGGSKGSAIVAALAHKHNL